MGEIDLRAHKCFWHPPWCCTFASLFMASNGKAADSAHKYGMSYPLACLLICSWGSTEYVFKFNFVLFNLIIILILWQTEKLFIAFLNPFGTRLDPDYHAICLFVIQII